jgi:uncharacterized protein (TIGR03437 family)
MPIVSRLGLLLFLPTLLCAQSTESAVFRAVLLPGNEVPAVNSANRGVADVIASVVRDPSGQIVSGTVDFLVRATVGAAVTSTGLDLHAGAAGQNGAVAISTGITASNSRTILSGGDTIHIAAAVTGSDAAALAALRGLFQDPSKFYVELAWTGPPNGAMRGQLQRAQMTVLMGMLSSGDVAPAPNASGHGAAQAVVFATRDGGGNFTSGEVYLTASFNANDSTAISGFHLHLGAAIALTAPVPPGLQVDPAGNALLGPIYTEVTVTNATQLGALANLFVNPGAVYVDVHTTANPNGVVRAQLRPTDAAKFPLLLDSTPAALTIYTLRDEDGGIAAASILADVPYRFPGPTQFLGVFLHDGAAGTDGPISVLLASHFASETGFGHLFTWTPPVANLDTIADILRNPENHYLAIHTFAAPAGAARGQLGAPDTAAPTIGAVLPANLDKSATAIAPGGLVTIFGAHLAKSASSLAGWSGQRVPASLDGVRVTIGGQAAPLLYISGGQINAQAPVELATGSRTVVVENANGVSAAFPVSVAQAAPAAFVAVKNSNFSIVSASNPAKAGDILVVYATGLGATTPAQATGVLAASTAFAQTAPVTATVADKPAAVVYSIASPQSIGLYQVAVTVPAGVTGSVPLLLQQGAAESGPIAIMVQ